MANALLIDSAITVRELIVLLQGLPGELCVYLDDWNEQYEYDHPLSCADNPRREAAQPLDRLGVSLPERVVIGRGRLRDADATTHPGYAAFCRQLRGKDYGESSLNSAWDAFKVGWAAGDDARATTPYLSRHLTHAERRRIALALRQLADASRQVYDFPIASIVGEVGRHREDQRAVAADLDRLAGEIERNGLRFADPASGNATTVESQ